MIRTAADVTATDVTDIFYLLNHSIPDLRQERTYTASAAVTSVWKRQWLVRLGKGLLPSLHRSWRSSWTGSSPSTRYSTVLQTNSAVGNDIVLQVSAHQKKDIWRAIAKDVRTLGVHQRRSTHCLKRWENIRRWSKKTAEAQLGRGARRTMTPLMFRILAVAYPELDGRLRASQQTQGGEYNIIQRTLRAVKVSGWGRRSVGFPRPGRVP
ncbi:hypothetical protein NDU88_000292 [Pleurodeles waltl]|uniref:Myb/SANT-like DNA-binding domain-containing protein n=1 Tax=Pleurodeles waltl TaxID=8319 RepID=A0AAV7SWJ8_PLEWA|nr:hypothetical protein NDU88_000292 [Pleurodeles waltl]